MARGGSRRGSGRPRDFDEVERAAIGATCNARIEEERERLRWQRYEQGPGMEDLRAAQAAARAAIGIPQLGELRNKVEIEIHAIRKTPSFVDRANREVDPTAVRFKGVKQRVIAEVAAQFTRKFGRIVTLRMVERCRAEHSKTVKRAALDV